MSNRASLNSLTTFLPIAVAVPEVRFTKPVRIPMVVVFPAPFGPSSPKNDPLGITKSIASIALNPPSYIFVNFSIFIADSNLNYLLSLRINVATFST